MNLYYGINGQQQQGWVGAESESMYLPLKINHIPSMSIYYLRDECETHLKAKALMYNSFLSSRPSLRPACISNLGGDILLNIDIQPGIRKLNNTVRGLTRLLLLFVMGDIPP